MSPPIHSRVTHSRMYNYRDQGEALYISSIHGQDLKGPSSLVKAEHETMLCFTALAESSQVGCMHTHYIMLSTYFFRT